MFPTDPPITVGWTVRRAAIRPDAYCLDHAPDDVDRVPLRHRDVRLFRCVVCHVAVTPRRRVLSAEDLDDRSDPPLIRGQKGQIARQMFGARAAEFLDIVREYAE